MPTKPAPVEERIGLAARLGDVWTSGRTGARVLSACLAPAEALFRRAVGWRNRAFDRGWLAVRRSPVPVISIGNIAVGGTGKTPFSAWLARELAGKGERPAILHGGYSADEPALHRTWNPDVPVYVGRDRLANAERAAADGATILVLDDGFQHRRLARDLDIVLVAAETWGGTRRLLPRGPWREPAASLGRADLVVITRKSADAATAARVAAAVAAAASCVPLCTAVLEPAGWRPLGTAREGPAGPCIAVAGIGEPAAFLANARRAGAEIERALLFGDHHEYTAGDAGRILQAGGARGIVTTEKDAPKLERRLPQAPIWALRQTARIETGGEGLDTLIDGIRR